MQHAWSLLIKVRFFLQITCFPYSNYQTKQSPFSQLSICFSATPLPNKFKHRNFSEFITPPLNNSARCFGDTVDAASLFVCPTHTHWHTRRRKLWLCITRFLLPLPSIIVSIYKAAGSGEFMKRCVYSWWWWWWWWRQKCAYSRVICDRKLCVGVVICVLYGGIWGVCK